MGSKSIFCRVDKSKKLTSAISRKIQVTPIRPLCTAYKTFVVTSIMNFRYKYSRKLTLCILHWLGRVNSVILDNLGKQGRVNSENFGVNSEIWKTSAKPGRVNSENFGVNSEILKKSPAKPGRVNSENLGVNSEILETYPRLGRQGQQ